MSALTDLLARCESWTSDAAMALHGLTVRRTALLKEAKRLKLTAAVKSILVLPRMGDAEPVAAGPIAPGPYPSAVVTAEGLEQYVSAQNGAAELGAPASSGQPPIGERAAAAPAPALGEPPESRSGYALHADGTIACNGCDDKIKPSEPLRACGHPHCGLAEAWRARVRDTAAASLVGQSNTPDLTPPAILTERPRK